ncbi:hypothetical protein [Mycobacterium sp. GA-2829]|uniref:hypothetical protein n=1 Tax=Mycobacterium sp. GA-2829 TaxID=1772283 RepID=UPI00073FE65F|nr:hypothetical protein [Mycobacterium sp. GA-2829]KUI27750.1 hypothetical protein AU194_21890 [Mycobacterium sp. GA-2829]
MIRVTYINPIPDDPKHIEENFTGWKYTFDPSGALILTKGKEKTAFGPGFWVRITDNDAPEDGLTRV